MPALDLLHQNESLLGAGSNYANDFLGSIGFLPNPSPSPVGGGGGLNIGINGPIGGGSTTTTTTTAPATGASIFAKCGFDPFCYLSNSISEAGNQLLRIILLIIGLLCVAGAIYLYKDTGSGIGAIVAAPVGLIKKGAGAGVKIAQSIAKTNE